jgi:hypothetical protein
VDRGLGSSLTGGEETALARSFFGRRVESVLTGFSVGRPVLTGLTLTCFLFFGGNGSACFSETGLVGVVCLLVGLVRGGGVSMTREAAALRYAVRRRRSPLAEKNSLKLSKSDEIWSLRLRRRCVSSDGERTHFDSGDRDSRDLATGDRDSLDLATGDLDSRDLATEDRDSWDLASGDQDLDCLERCGDRDLDSRCGAHDFSALLLGLRGEICTRGSLARLAVAVARGCGGSLAGLAVAGGCGGGDTMLLLLTSLSDVAESPVGLSGLAVRRRPCGVRVRFSDGGD